IGADPAIDMDKILATDDVGIPYWEGRSSFTSSSLNTGEVLVGTPTGLATAVTMGGDAIIDETGQLTIANDSISTIKIADSAVTTFKIRALNITNYTLSLHDALPI